MKREWPDLHPLTWLLWLMAVMSAISTTRNPFYQLLLVLGIMVAGEAAGRSRSWFSPAWLGMVLGISVLLSGLFYRYGNTVLIRIPENIPLIGGAITAEALVYGATNGLILCGVLVAFALFNRKVSYAVLLRWIPRAFYPLTLILSIALTYVPVTIRQFEQIKEAQMVRGHEVRRLRDWLPLFLPLLISGLERAIALSEAMMARGFVKTLPYSRHNTLFFGGFLILLAGWVVGLFPDMGLASGLLAAAGFAMMGLVIWKIGRNSQRSVYRKLAFSWLDIIAAVSLAPFFLPLILRENFPVEMSYSPYPQLQLPPFNPVVLVILMGLIFPALCGARDD
ncbi:MAG TPA: energy-coupling factor transporter transmembrane component T [Anaerolineaceae bacterium]|nr:energy-coupling factor transporter transmembrane component T [Anaerolineaceae bacterium]HPN52436.1 energy-coupling factor transporter transmembrane component T [Anaerolineaceae bacterium]